ncbi:unnamed protein product [Dicrocoelium dendriticum]|nr:unnamed protein product [Dicrocoelium dendriticum]
MIYSAHKDWPFQMQMRQLSIRSQHPHYPLFHRTHQEVFLTMGHNRSASLQAEWNIGSRNGELRQGVVILRHHSQPGVTDLRIDIIWTEGDQPSELYSTVQTYSRSLKIVNKLKRPGMKSSDLSIGFNQSLSQNFWMLHTNQPGIFSANLWTEAETYPQLNSKASVIWRFGYQLDQGGDTWFYASLSIPEKVR